MRLHICLSPMPSSVVCFYDASRLMSSRAHCTFSRVAFVGLEVNLCWNLDELISVVF